MGLWDTACAVPWGGDTACAEMWDYGTLPVLDPGVGTLPVPMAACRAGVPSGLHLPFINPHRFAPVLEQLQQGSREGLAAAAAEPGMGKLP